MGSWKTFFSWLAWNSDGRVSAFHIAWHDTCAQLHLAVGWDGGSQTFCWVCPQTSLLISTFQVYRITDVYRQHLGFLVFWDSVSLCIRGWPQTCSPASKSWIVWMC
jgi:hypothetical protein